MVAVLPTFHRMPKAEKKGVSLRPDLQGKAQERADRRHKGNFSAYIQSLIEADLAQEPVSTAHSPRILSDLAQSYAGYFAPTLARQLDAQEANQPELLHRLLLQLSEHLACGGSVKDIAVRGVDFTSYHPLPDSFRKDDRILHDEDVAAMARFIERRSTAMLEAQKKAGLINALAAEHGGESDAEGKAAADSAKAALAAASPGTPPARPRAPRK